MAKNLNISNISTNSGAAAGLSKGVSSSTINSTAGTSIKPSSSSSRYYHSAGSRSSYHSATSHYDLQLMVTELFNACKSGDCAGIARYCQTTPKAVNVLLNYRDLNGNTGILYASANGHLEVVKLILKFGGDCNSKNDYGWSSLMLASFHNYSDLVEYLLSVGNLDVNAVNSFGLSALHLAIFECHFGICQLLLGGGASNVAGGTTSPSTSSPGVEGGVEKLSVRAEQISSAHPGSSGMTPLMVACLVQKEAVVKSLIESGSEINAQNQLNGWTALMYATNKRQVNLDLIKLLVDNGADIFVKAWDDRMVTDLAKEAGFTELQEYFETIEQISPSMASYQVPTVNESGEKHAIFDAIEAVNHKLVQELITSYPNCCNEINPSDGMTPLMVASVKGDLVVGKLLVEHGADLRATDGANQWNALMYAASNNQIDFLQLLIKSGAKIPLSPSTMKDEAEIVRELSKITVNSEIIEVLRGCIEPDFELSIGSFDKGSTNKTKKSSRLSVNSRNVEQSWFQRLLNMKWKKKKQSSGAVQVSNESASSKSKPVVIKKKNKSNSSKQNNSNTASLKKLNKKVSMTSISSSLAAPSMKNGESRHKIQDQAFDHQLPSRKQSVAGIDSIKNSDSLHHRAESMQSTRSPVSEGVPRNWRELSRSTMDGGSISGKRKSGSSYRAHVDPSLKSTYSISVNSASNASIADNLITTISDAREVKTFLQLLDLEQYNPIFEKASISTVNELATLGEHNLEQLGIQVPGHRRLILFSCHTWKSEQHKRQFRRVHDKINGHGGYSYKEKYGGGGGSVRSKSSSGGGRRMHDRSRSNSFHHPVNTGRLSISQNSSNLMTLFNWALESGDGIGALEPGYSQSIHSSRSSVFKYQASSPDGLHNGASSHQTPRYHHSRQGSNSSNVPADKMEMIKSIKVAKRHNKAEIPM